MEEVKAEIFFKRLEIYLIFIMFLTSLLCLLISKKLIWGISFFSGGILGFLNFRSTKNEGLIFIKKIQEGLKLGRNVSIEKEKNIFLFKIFLKLLATGIVLFVLIAKFHFHPVMILLSFFIVYTSVVLISLKYFIFDKS